MIFILIDMFNMNTPTDNEICKMFDIADAYLTETRQEGWTWKGAIDFFKKHWNDEEFNVNYLEIIEENLKEI